MEIHQILNDVSGFYKIMALSFTILTIIGIIINIRYTVPKREELSSNINRKEYLESTMRQLDTRIREKNEESLVNYMKYYFTGDQIREILRDYIKYEIKVNGEKITSGNLNYNSKQGNVTIEIAAYFDDSVYPLEFIAESCPLRICSEEKEILDLISLHTTIAGYSFEARNSGKKHTYTYNVPELTPGEIITLKINEPEIRMNLNPSITQLEVTRTK